MKIDQPSSTAQLIAAAQIIAAREHRLHSLVDLESVDLSRRLLRAAHGQWLAIAAESFLSRKLLLGFERLMLRGLIWHWLLRKRKIEELIRQAIAEGFSQLVVLGAGLDTLPLRLGREGSLQDIICIDHPATQAAVRTALPELDLLDSRITLIPIDLTNQSLTTNQRFPEALAASPTIILAEGLLMYLDPDRVRALLSEVASLSVPRARMILTAMDSPATEVISFRPRSRRAERWLSKRAEPMRSSIPAGMESEVLLQSGFHHLRTITAQDLRGNQPGLDGENIIIAESTPNPRP